MQSRFLQTAALLVLAGACTVPSGESKGPDSAPAVRDLGLVRMVLWPGGGRELTVRVASTADLSDAFYVTSRADIEAAVTLEPLDPGFTALLVRPAHDPAARATLVADLSDFVRSRPAGDRIAVFAWGRGDAEQVGNFSANRDRVLDRVSQFAHIEASPLASASAISDLEKLVLKVGGKAERVMRSIVVVDANANANADAEDVAARATAVPIVHGLADASTRIDELAATSHYRVAVCSASAAVTAAIRVDGVEGSLEVELPPTLPEEVDAVCDPTQIGPGKRSYPRTIEFVLDGAQREAYDSRVATRSKARFDVGIRLAPGGHAIAARAHLRGRGSLNCERKSYTVALEGPGRHLLPKARTDEFYLLSMCLDDGYVNQYTANQLLKQMGLFPLEFGFVELRIDGETHGVYLLVEKAREELVRDNSRVRSVLRRRYSPPDTWFQVKYSDVGITSVAAPLHTDTIEEHLDLEQYLRFIALMTAYQNGDYVDEIWLTHTDHMRADGTTTEWFDLMAWDNDDLFSTCHRSAEYAVDDPNGLIFCAKAPLDHALFASSTNYERYIDALEEVLVNDVTEGRFAEAARATEAALLPFFDDPAIVAAMAGLVAGDPPAVDPVVATSDIRAKLSSLVILYASRRALLLDRIESWRVR